MAFRGGGGGIDRITSSGGTITITSPVGPVTNLEGAAQAVSSVFGRTGAVVAATNDYTAAQVANAVTLAPATAQTIKATADVTALTIEGATGGTADIVHINKGSGAVLFSIDPSVTPATISLNGNAVIGGGGILDASQGAGAKLNPITSGALPTVSPSSGTAFRCTTARDVFLCLTITYTLIASTCKVELSPDNSTFSTLGTYDPGVAGAVDPINFQVPAGWWVKVTLSNASVTAATYY